MELLDVILIGASLVFSPCSTRQWGTWSVGLHRDHGPVQPVARDHSPRSPVAQRRRRRVRNMALLTRRVCGLAIHRPHHSGVHATGIFRRQHRPARQRLPAAFGHPSGAFRSLHDLVRHALAPAIRRRQAKAAGGTIGLFSGLSGIGGGVLLSPLFLISGWAGARQTAGIAAAFILFNSIAGLAGTLTGLNIIPPQLLPWAVLVLAGSVVGTGLGVRSLPVKPLVFVLAAAVLISGLKFVLL